MYTVDGLPCNTFQEADIVAKRLYKRYNGLRTIKVLQDGEEIIAYHQESYYDEDERQLSIFGD